MRYKVDFQSMEYDGLDDLDFYDDDEDIFWIKARDAGNFRIDFSSQSVLLLTSRPLLQFTDTCASTMNFFCSRIEISGVLERKTGKLEWKETLKAKACPKSALRKNDL